MTRPSITCAGGRPVSPRSGRHNQLGRVLFLKRQYAEAVAEFKKVLEVDAEDLQAHYNLMLAYQGLGETGAADQERTLYERFKADESAQAITGQYRQLHPDDNNERQQIHEHRSARPDERSKTPGGHRSPTPDSGAAAASAAELHLQGMSRPAMSRIACSASLSSSARSLAPVLMADPQATAAIAESGSGDLRRRHRPVRHQLPSQQRCFGKKYLPETMGSGRAFFDADGDGWQDILLVNSTNWPGAKGPSSRPALYRNNRDGTFTDITEQAGLAVELYGLGVSAADFDNDGHADIYLTRARSQIACFETSAAADSRM